MTNQIRLSLGIFALALLLVHGVEPAINQSLDRWQVIPLMTNEILSARLRVLRVASAADENWMILEMENLTSKPLSVQQTWFGLDAERRDPVTDRLLASGGLTPGSVFRGVITSGVVRVSANLWPAVSAGLGCPPQTGIKIVATARLGLMTDNGHFTSTPSSFTFNWIYPDAAGISAMKARLKHLLRNRQYQFAHGNQLRTLFAIPEAADDPTAGELLDGLKTRQNTVDGRNVIASQLGRRFANDPNVVAFVFEDLKKGKLDDVLGQGIWNPVFVPSLVDNFEKTGDHATLAYVLGPHRGDWGSNTQVVARLSAALLKHRTLLATNVSQLGTNDLFAWAAGAHEASIIGERGLLKILATALDDQRMAIHPHEKELANIPDRRRVCDHALEAIAAVMGISIYEEYGLRRGVLGLEPQADFNRAIGDLKKRIATVDAQQQSFSFKQVALTTEQRKQLDLAIGSMNLQKKADIPCENLHDAAALLWRSINIAIVDQPAAAEYRGFFVFSRLDWAKKDDGTFRSGFAVEKGTGRIYRWEDRSSQ